MSDYSIAQKPTYNLKGGKMQITLPRSIAESELNSFISKFDLGHLSLKRLLSEGYADSIQINGWEIEEINNVAIIINKVLASSDVINDPAGRIMFTGDKPWRVDLVFPAISNSVTMGYNRFRNKAPFAIRDSIVYFYLRNNQQARDVVLSGSFNDWDARSLHMKKTDSGWIAGVKLKPGKYWYKFIIDGDWVMDSDNSLSESDGVGNSNSVFYYTNTVFTLQGFLGAKRVYLAGSFNNWDSKHLLMQKTATGWQLPLYLRDGTHTYRFVADGSWFPDPQNPKRYPNEYNEYNSVIAIGSPHIFRLGGFPDAKQVLLTGSFNAWRKDELYMQKTADGWEFPYVLGAGNHEYAFIVDGKQIADPANQTETGNHNSSYLVLQPNYTFRLKGFEKAKTIYLSGDFVGWSPNALAMRKGNGEWTLTVHLSPGKHLYKYVVDGNWIIDPDNKLWEENEHNTGNSVIWVDN